MDRHRSIKVLLLSKSCLQDLCITDDTNVDLEADPGQTLSVPSTMPVDLGCKDGYSVAIGSSNCIQCPNNNNLALLIFFAAAGFLLVFFVCVLNLTVSQGYINGFIFYANIVRAYQNVFLPSVNYRMFIFVKTFIAWLSLDFGIETCFIKGLDSYTKTWLQFIFPLYTAGMFFIGLKYSTKLLKLVGSRSVPTLATLLFLTYNKRLRTIIAGMNLATFTTYYESGKESSAKIWALDGNLIYGHHPHIYLLLAVTACFAFLWIPYTLLLLFMQWLRRVDHYSPLKILARYKPSYYGLLRDKHHYWFGVLLVAQGLLLVVSSLTLNQVPFVNLLLLLGVVVCYLNHIKPYKHRSVTLLETSFFVNILVLTAGNLYFRRNIQKAILMMFSGTIVVIEFTMIVLWNLVLKKINDNCGTRISNKITSMHATPKYKAEGSCTLDVILKNTGGDVHYKDLILRDTKD